MPDDGLEGTGTLGVSRYITRGMLERIAPAGELSAARVSKHALHDHDYRHVLHHSDVPALVVPTRLPDDADRTDQSAAART